METDVTRQPQLSETSRSTFTVESPHAQGPAFPGQLWYRASWDYKDLAISAQLRL